MISWAVGPLPPLSGRAARVIVVSLSAPVSPLSTVRFTAAEFDAFLDGARNAEFDHLLTG
jgi:hypothetical protein